MVKIALKTTFVYFILSLLWVTLSDKVAFILYETSIVSAESYYLIQSLKGYFFVLLTTIGLFYLINKQIHKVEEVKDDFIRLFEQNPNPMWIYDLTTFEILTANNAAVDTYGFDHEEFKSLTIFDLRPESEHQKLRDNIKATEASRKNYDKSFTWLHRKKNGDSFYVNIYSHPTNFNNKVCRIITAIDIDRAFRTELDLININKALKFSTHLCITDLTGIIIEVNEIFARTAGYTIDELVGKKISLLSSTYHNQSFWLNFWETLDSGQVWRGEICNKARDGSIFWYGTVVTPIFDQNDNVYKFMSISSEITQEKQLEADQFRKSEQLKDYAQLTSHDIRGPLTRLLALTDFYDLAEESEIDFVLTNIKKTSLELDVIIRQMNEKVESDLAI